MATTPEPVETTSIQLKAPTELFERLDRWREQTAKRKQMTMAPSRPASIRWIVHQFLLKQEQQRGKHKKKKT